jgi:hypothetical protein
MNATNSNDACGVADIHDQHSHSSSTKGWRRTPPGDYQLNATSITITASVDASQ